MELKNYLGYIAHFYKNLSQTITKSDFVFMLSSNLGARMFNAPPEKVRDTARLLYKSYVTSMYTKYGAFHIASKLNSKTIDAYLVDVISLNKKYGLFYDTVDYDFTVANIDANIKNDAVSNYKSILSELSEEDAVPSRSKAKPASSIKPKVKANVRSQVGKRVNTKVKSQDAVPVGKIINVRAKTKKPIVLTKTCKDYKIPELKSMAAALKIKGTGKMKKAELCEVLGI